MPAVIFPPVVYLVTLVTKWKDYGIIESGQDSQDMDSIKAILHWTS